MGENKIKEQGVAVIYYSNTTTGAEQQPEGNVDRNRYFQGLFYDIYGGAQQIELDRPGNSGTRRRYGHVQS